MLKEKISHFKESLTPYAHSSVQKSLIQMGTSILPFVLLWFLSFESLRISIWLAVPFAVCASGFVIRIFIIFHDCAHFAFFKNNRANRLIGNITGILTLFPYEQWKNEHAVHHAASGNLDKRGTGDIWVMTIQEYIDASFWKRFTYRLYRNPIILFGLGPLYLYLIKNRFNRKGAQQKEKLNTYMTNGAIVLLFALLLWGVGWKALLIIQLPILILAGSLGIWLFYVQHQFEDSYYENEEKWDFVRAAVDGSSYYKLPKFLQWITGNIGYHHVHHLVPRIPNYNLQKVHEAAPDLQQVTTITIRTSLQSLRFRLYDETNKAFVGFKEIRPLLRKSKKFTPNPSTS